MAITTFDTLKFVLRLEEAGMPSDQAEAQAEVFTEAFNVNLKELVTKEFLESRLDVRFAEQKAYIDTQFAKQDAHFKVLYWMLGIVVATTAIPFLQTLTSLQ